MDGRQELSADLTEALIRHIGDLPPGALPPGPLPPGPWPVLGAGIWGRVVDLGDGTVLKLPQRGGLGIGSVDAIVAREIAVLKRLDGMHGARFAVPKLLSSGMLPGQFATNLEAPLIGWLRMGKLEGQTLPHERLAALAPDARDRLGERLGAAIADFHEGCSAQLAKAPLELSDPLLRSLKDGFQRLGNAHEMAVSKALAEAWSALEGSKQFIHADLNAGNMLVPADPDGPIGFVDFAEAGVSFLEGDFRHMEQVGFIRDALFRGYRARRDKPIDLHRYFLAAAINALGSIAIQGNRGHPRDVMRRRGELDYCLREAGIEI